MAFSLRNAFRFICLLKVEPFVFLSLCIYIIKRIPIDQMIQDKICLQKYGMDKEYCHNLPTMKDEDDYVKKKSIILGDVTEINMLVNLINMIPTVIMAIFVGPFIDKNIKAKKLMMVLALVVSTVESILNILNCYFFNLSYYFLMGTQIWSGILGGLLISLASTLSYVSAVTPIHLRTSRMAIIETFLFAALPVSTAISGFLIAMKPVFGDFEPRNYSINFVVAFIFCCVAFINVIFFVDEKKDKEKFHKAFPVDDKTQINVEQVVDEMRARSLSNSSFQLSVDLVKMKNQEVIVQEKSIIKQIFDTQNVIDMYETCTKKRIKGIRLQIVLLFLCLMFFLLSYMGPAAFLFQYVQKLFLWNTQKYSLYYSASSTINLITMLIFAPLLIRVFNMSDLHITLIGLTTMFLQSTMRLFSTSEEVFYLSLIFSSINSVGSVGIRTYLSKIVDDSEQGRIFSLMTAVDSIVPVFASVVLSNTFRLTIDTMPNISFGIIAGGLLIAIIIVLWVSLKSKETLEAVRLDKENRKKSIENKEPKAA